MSSLFSQCNATTPNLGEAAQGVFAFCRPGEKGLDLSIPFCSREALLAEVRVPAPADRCLGVILLQWAWQLHSCEPVPSPEAVPDIKSCQSVVPKLLSSASLHDVIPVQGVRRVHCLYK